MQWVFETYGRDHAALCSTVIRYRARGAMRAKLAKAAEALDVSACNEAVSELYELTPEEKKMITGS